MTTSFIDVGSLEDLTQILKAAHICTDGWRKSVLVLFKELQEGDCRLQKNEKHGLIRTVDVTRIFCVSKNGTLKLVEDKQIHFKTGQTIRRGHECICEKAKSHESLFEAARRGLQEELQMDTKKLIIIKKPTSKAKDVELSASYNTLMCVYTYHDFQTIIPEDQWKEEYVEVQQDKCTYFVWKINSS